MTPAFLPPPFIFQVIPTSKLILLWLRCCEAGAARPVLALLHVGGWHVGAGGLQAWLELLLGCGLLLQQCWQPERGLWVVLQLLPYQPCYNTGFSSSPGPSTSGSALPAVCRSAAVGKLCCGAVLSHCPVTDRSLAAAGNLPCAPGSPSR